MKVDGVNDDSGLPTLGFLLDDCGEDTTTGATMGIFEGFADTGTQELTGTRDGCKYGTLLGRNDTNIDGISMEGSQVGSGEGSLVGVWVMGEDVGPAEKAADGSIVGFDDKGDVVDTMG